MSSYGGIDLGGTKIQAVIVDEEHNALGSARRATPTEGGPSDVAKEMETVLRDAAKAAEVEPEDLAGVGVGSPGVIEDGKVTSARNLPDWEGTFPLAGTLEKALGCKVEVGNDVQVATDAEFRLGVGRLYDSLLGVFWGTGVGGGLILDGKPWVGRGGAGEIGHVVVELDGARCTCGRRGCMEAYAGRAAMELHVRKLHEEKGRKTDLFKLMEHHERTRLTSGIWARALEREDKLAIQVLDRAVRALGAGIASVVNVLDVEGVVIGGGLGVRLGHPYAKRISEEMQPHLFNDSQPPHVHVAALGDLGGAIGASLLISDAELAE
ncbi:MAG TPA: ROK family protein [Solirubrobacteraceae bacterium]|jgi:glucokinase|nr:ROK family protein [Solirubrobacteraceae bacterium]